MVTKRGWGTKAPFSYTENILPLYSWGDLGVMKLNIDEL